MRRDDVDPRRLHLDEVRVRVHEVAAEALAVGQVGRDVDDVGVEVRHVGRAGREHCDSPLERLRRDAAAEAGRSTTRSETSRRYVSRYGSRSARPVTSTRRAVATGGMAAPLPSKSTRSGRSSAARRAPSATFETATPPARPPPARRQPIVGTPASAAISRWSEAAWRPASERATSSSTVGGALDQLGLRRPAASHRDDDDAAVAREEARQVDGDGRLADALAGADHRDRRQLERLQLRRVEAEVGADVGETRRERARRPLESLDRAEHGLVGEVDDDLRRPEAVDQRDAVVAAVPFAELLGAADEDRSLPLVRERCERVAHHRRIVLTVDERDRPRHRRAVTSLSIRPVYFSYSPVETSNWMIRSCPWNGYRRHTVTCEPSISTTL